MNIFPRNSKTVLLIFSGFLFMGLNVNAQRENPPIDEDAAGGGLLIEGKIPKKTKDRPSGKDEPQNEAIKEVTARSQNQVADIMLDYVNKYASLISSHLSEEAALNASTFTTIQKSLIKVSGRVILAWDVYNVVEDAKQGKWGGIVCLAAGAFSGPYATIGSMLCTQALTVFRIYDETKRPKR